MLLRQANGVFALAAAELQNYWMVVPEKLVPPAFQRKALLLNTLVRVFKEIFKCLTFGETFEFVLFSHSLIFYATAMPRRYNLSL